MQYLLYCVVCFRDQSTIKEVFVANVVSNEALANGGVFTHAQDAKVASMWYRRANGIPSPSNSDTNSR